MKKRLYLALLLTLTTACVLTGCNGCNTETVEETTEVTSDEVSEEIISEETDTTESSEEVTEETTEDTSEEVTETVFEPYEAVVNYTANLRADASIESEKVGLIVEGETVTVLEEIGQWSKISYEEKEVYILAQYLDKTETESEPAGETTTEETNTSEEAEEEKPAYTVTDMEKTMYAQRSVNVRSGPGTGYDKLGALNTNDEVKVTGQADNGWYRIEYKGNEGFVSNNYLGDAKVVVNNTTPATPNNNGTSNNTTQNNPSTTTPTTPTTPTVDTSNLTSRVVNGTTTYVYRTTANGTPIYEVQNGDWPQYILDVINQCCTPDMSDMEKATVIYNWMVTNITYNGNNYYYTTRDTLTYRNAVCNGYANAYQSLCCSVGISASVVTGYSLTTTTGNNGHAWNFIYIDGVKYFTDTSNNNPLNSNITIYTDENNNTVMEFINSNGSKGKIGMQGEYWNGYLDAL